jgi:superfamily II DNA or RNA helicase
MKLRNYQEQAIKELRAAFLDGHKRVILCAPTGAGKTVMFSAMVKMAVDKANKVLIVTDRKELLTQSGGALESFKIKSGELTPKTKKVPSSLVTVAMVETLARRLKKDDYLHWFKSLDLIIFDEAHKQNFDKLFKLMNAKTYVIGATATPHREGNQTELKEYYSKIIEPVNIASLIEKGFLAEPISYGVKLDLKGVKTRGGDFDNFQVAQKFEEYKTYEGVVKNYMRICNNAKALLFAGTIASSKRVLQEFISLGYNAKHIDSTMSSTERDNIIHWYKTTENAILCNVGILTTGFDAPSTKCVILYRATKSLPLFLQMCGRGARVTEGKKEFYILDFGENLKRLQFWQDATKWSLKKKVKKKGLAPVKDCTSCGALIHTTLMECPYCGFEFERSSKVTQEVELIKYGKDFSAGDRNTYKHAEKANIEELVKMCKAKVLRPFWVIYNRTNSTAEALNFTKKLGYKDGWLFHQKRNGHFKHLK